MTEWVERPKIELDSALHAKQRVAAIPDEALDASRALLDAVSAEVPAAARVLADAVRIRTKNRFHDEMVAVAHRVGVSWREVMLANISYDLVIAAFGCSTVALATADGPVLARNMDWFPERLLARASYNMIHQDNGEMRFINAGWPGATGVVTGLSARGFAIALNAVLSPEGVKRTGYPVLLYLRKVLEDAADYHDAMDRLSRQKLASPCLLTVVGTNNHERITIERSPTQSAHRTAGGDAEPLVTTNDYRALFETDVTLLPELYQTTCTRFDALSQCLADHDPDESIDDEPLLEALTRPDVMQEITAQHVIMRPRDGTCRLFVPRSLL